MMLFLILGYVEAGDYIEAFGFIIFDVAWSYLYVAYNYVLYQWVFSVHRVNLYGGQISVAEFK